MQTFDRGKQTRHLTQVVCQTQAESGWMITGKNASDVVSTSSGSTLVVYGSSLID